MDLESFTSRLETHSPRLRAGKGITARWEALNSSNLVEFALACQAFGHARVHGAAHLLVQGAYRLTGGPERAIRTRDRARTSQNDAGCQLLIALHGDEAHYLFGHEWRGENSRARPLSPSAVAHRLAIHHALEQKMSSYDFNGALEHPEPGNPYSGVSEFKAQFGGKLICYGAARTQDLRLKNDV